MRIIFAYFDFTEGKHSGIPHSLGECSLNFSTSHNYSVSKIINSEPDGKECVYNVSCSEKQKNECIPDGFWGERIYNVTAIVGINGSGKSTIIHNMIKAVVYGLKPEVPFLIVLQKTESDDLCLYCSDNNFRWEELQLVQCEYPEDLKYTKSMLLDNTLSFSTIALDDLYEAVNSFDRVSIRDIMPEPITENLKQFYNKSLIGSIRYSISMSMANRVQRYIPVSEMIASHFRYETYQEVRFLFDRFQQRNLSALKDKHFSVPLPKNLFVSILSFEALCAVVGSYNEVANKRNIGLLPIVFEVLYDYGFIGEILAAAFFNLYADSIGTSTKETFDSVFNIASDISQQTNGVIDKTEEALLVARKVLDGIGYLSQDGSWCPEYLRKHVKDIKRFTKVVSENAYTLLDIFEPSVLSNSEEKAYQIDVYDTVSDTSKRECMISFLDSYRRISAPAYFLIFSSGMSSGEKNYLRMLTQFRYLLDGPSVYPIDATEKDTGDYLKNVFPHSQESYVCDTLFLFLDESDLTYHPEWQRIFISKLISTLPRMFRNPYNVKKGEMSGCKDIQVILATHSPIMLGDFPKACVNYLKGNDQTDIEINQIQQQSTFGENLYTILKNSFFMKGTLGEFARHKINDVVQRCSDLREYIGQSETESIKVNNCGQTSSEEIQKSICRDHARTVLLLPRGIIQSKLIAELTECAGTCATRCSGECVIKKELLFFNKEERELNELKKKNDELNRKLEAANEKLRKAGLLNEQNP